MFNSSTTTHVLSFLAVVNAPGNCHITIKVLWTLVMFIRLCIFARAVLWFQIHSITRTFRTKNIIIFVIWCNYTLISTNKADLFTSCVCIVNRPFHTEIGIFRNIQCVNYGEKVIITFFSVCVATSIHKHDKATRVAQHNAQNAKLLARRG